MTTSIRAHSPVTPNSDQQVPVLNDPTSLLPSSHSAQSTRPYLLNRIGTQGLSLTPLNNTRVSLPVQQLRDIRNYSIFGTFALTVGISSLLSTASHHDEGSNETSGLHAFLGLINTAIGTCLLLNASKKLNSASLITLNLTDPSSTASNNNNATSSNINTHASINSNELTERSRQNQAQRNEPEIDIV